ncbi:MAG: DUF4437 domain-containing protein [Pyrinomonadaceae bacterium]|nr:DUF4437 domain-containing protein [Pyrinomonadaceae bacterium]
MIKTKLFILFAFVSIIVGLGDIQITAQSKDKKNVAKSTNKVVLASEVKWTPLNPARGVQSPQAGTLWGDRNGTEPTGFLVKFADGFSSPPHIHNVAYRGVVISGEIHNDDPKAENMWMPKGSFWTQPAGEGHITSAKGKINLAYIEIDKGPYLVRPTEKAFDNGERPINVHASNIVWVDQSKTSVSKNPPKLAFLWGDPQVAKSSGTLINLPANFNGKIQSFGSNFRAVVIEGQLKYEMPGGKNAKILEPGSFFSSKGKSIHQVSSATGEESIIYVRTNGKFDVVRIEK